MLEFPRVVDMCTIGKMMSHSHKSCVKQKPSAIYLTSRESVSSRIPLGTDNALDLRDFVGLLILGDQHKIKTNQPTNQPNKKNKKSRHFLDQFYLVKIVKSLQMWL